MTTDLWAYLVLRPISFYLTPLFINLGFSANVVTVLGLITLICGLVFIVSGASSPFNLIIGAYLVNIWYFLDCIDGNIARYLGQSSKFGALLDSIVGLTYHTFLPLCLGLVLFLASPEQVPRAFGLEFPRWCWLVAGAVMSSAGLFRKVVGLQARSFAEDQVRKRENARITLGAVLPRAIISFIPPLLFIAAHVGVFGLFLFGYAVYDLLSLIGVIVQSLRNALLVDRHQLDSGKNP